MSMYALYSSELKARYSGTIISLASKEWRKKGLSMEECSEKMDELIERLQRASKSEFIEIYWSYITRRKIE